MILAQIMLSPFWVSTIYGSIAFVLGASVGSFLNVVIYRVPRGMSVGKPKRSFCPSCEKQIPWYLNIPLVSWIILRGKCAYCGSRISFRYFLVELITALFFLAVWLYYPYPKVAFCLWILVAMLIAATFIDLEFYIIPDSITIGGAVVGVICSLLVPELMREGTMVRGFLKSLLGAAVGYGSLWAVVHLGKLAFGRVKQEFEKPVDWGINQTEEQEEPELSLGEEKTTWSEFFFRPSDRIILACNRIRIRKKEETIEKSEVTANVYFDRIEIGDDTIALSEVEEVDGNTTGVVIPREAMGYGDVKFMALIGAFLGWPGVLFSIFCGSVSGALVGLLARITGQQEWSSKIPFGPFLAFGAVVWMFYGRDIVEWYLLRMG